jgi:HEPN domain-containing protein
MRRETRQWIHKGEGDYRLAVRIAGGREPFHDQQCFHCQQASEKYLKAYMEELGLAIPKIHDLNELLDRLLPHDAKLKSLRRGLVTLSRFAVEYRYPGENATKRDAETAMRKTERIRKEIRKRLGLAS